MKRSQSAANLDSGLNLKRMRTNVAAAAAAATVSGGVAGLVPPFSLPKPDLPDQSNDNGPPKEFHTQPNQKVGMHKSVNSFYGYILEYVIVFYGSK